MGQNAEVMPRPLNLSLVIHSLEVRTIFSLFVLKKHMRGFAQIISVFRTGCRFARIGVGYPVSIIFTPRLVKASILPCHEYANNLCFSEGGEKLGQPILSPP